MSTAISVDYVVASGKKELERLRVIVDTNARTVEGSAIVPDDDADVTFTLTPALAEAIRSGQLKVGVGFMRGSVKMSGNFGAVLDVLELLDRTPAL